MPASSFAFTPAEARVGSETELPDLQRASEYFRLLVENSADLMVEIRPEGEVLYVSSNVCNILGYAVAELLHTSIFSSLHPEDLAEAKTQLARAEGRGIFRCRHKNGSWRWIETTGREFLGFGAQLRRVIIARDVTARKEAEAARRQLEGELYKSAKLGALGMLSAGIAHDFNQILTAVSVQLEIVRNGSTEAPLQESLGHVGQAIEKAQQLAAQILNFSQRQTEDHQLVQLPTLIDEVLHLLRPTWPAGVELLTHFPSDPGWVMASPIKLHQVLTNLFANAVQAMASGGKLEVRVGSVVVDQLDSAPQPDMPCGRYVQLTVSDTGHGMDAATQQRIFEPFFTTKRPGQGTGLGLSVVQRIVEEHGAHLQVSSEAGRGTTFRIFFAAKPNLAAA